MRGRSDPGASSPSDSGRCRGAPAPGPRRAHLLLQGVLGREGGLGGGRPVADAALEQVEPRGPGAGVGLEVEEHVLQQREPLGVPFCVVGAPLAQVALPGAVLLRQQPQVGDVPVIEPHPLLHLGGHRQLLTWSPPGSRRAGPWRAAATPATASAAPAAPGEPAAAAAAHAAAEPRRPARAALASRGAGGGGGSAGGAPRPGAASPADGRVM